MHFFTEEEGQISTDLLVHIVGGKCVTDGSFQSMSSGKSMFASIRALRYRNLARGH
jgi:hypothetical protein